MLRAIVDRFLGSPADPALLEGLLIRAALLVAALAALRVLASLGAAWWRRNPASPEATTASGADATAAAPPCTDVPAPALLPVPATGQRSPTDREGEAGVTAEHAPLQCAFPEQRSDAHTIEVHEFVVRVLGPVDVVDRHGKEVMVGRARSTELLAWLALHRTGSTRSAARAAMWDAEISDAAFANVVSGARRALARHAPGLVADWLGHLQSESLVLDVRVVSDVDLFGTHVLHARRSSGQQRASALRAALALVRGAPLLGANYRWADDEALTSSLTLLVVDAARDLGEVCLRSGDHAAVLQATAVGLGVLPGHEELVALRLRAHHAAGALAALRAEWESYCRAVELDSWSTGPAPWLAELAHDLLGGRALR